jgi:uncharacterized protein
MVKIKKLVTNSLILLIKSYRYLISPFLGNRCRFYPSCSNYAEQALKEHGILKGGYLSLRRILRCNPLHLGGIDLVPESKHKNRSFL